MMRPLTIAACLALTTVAAFASTDASAQAPAQTPAATPAATTPSPAGSGDAARGRQLTYTCHGCHGVTGYRNAYPNYHVPKLRGQSKEFLMNSLLAYKNGQRKHPTMQAQSQSFSDQDIADIAAYLSTSK